VLRHQEIGKNLKGDEMRA
jgi:hypothetical protein